ncbi:uncharacterized protein LOC135961373 [Calliphora vicina]|uniref:uncharacterized protein LOC135961373 n=1 Tax=Calliphora vicina TaxID=7373 RepID=UPI00325B9084
MSLPNGFINSYEYFQQVNEFLKKNSWIYREANTGFVKAGTLNQMPQEYKDYFTEINTEELNKFPYVHEPLTHLNVESLNNFRHKLAELIPLAAYNEPQDVEKPIKMENLKKMNVKKQHEIQRLATVVKETLKLNEDEHQNEEQEKYVLIDFGSGLGYLSEMLYKLNRNLLILGLEADTYRVEAAEKRVKTYMPTAINSIQYRQQFITESSKDFIVKTVEEVFKLNYQHVAPQIATNVVIIGLHACADLTITSLKLFLQLPEVQHLIIMPCCYHKLQVCDDTATTTAAALKFRNFPLSESLKQVLLDNEDNVTDKANYAECNDDFTTYLNRPFLRLACQQTLKRWNKCSPTEHHVHGSEMFLRAVAESIKLKDEELEFIVVKRKEEKIELNSLTAEQLQSFETFSRLYSLKSKTTNEFVVWSAQHRKKFCELIEKYPNGGKLAEGLTCLQTSMQKLCENLVLYDRLCYMEETALKMDLKIKVRYEKIMDEELSPRCYVLIADKL